MHLSRHRFQNQAHFEPILSLSVLRGSVTLTNSTPRSNNNAGVGKCEHLHKTPFNLMGIGVLVGQCGGTLSVDLCYSMTECDSVGVGIGCCE